MRLQDRKTLKIGKFIFANKIFRENSTWFIKYLILTSFIQFFSPCSTCFLLSSHFKTSHQVKFCLYVFIWLYIERYVSFVRIVWYKKRQLFLGERFSMVLPVSSGLMRFEMSSIKVIRSHAPQWICTGRIQINVLTTYRFLRAFLLHVLKI